MSIIQGTSKAAGGYAIDQSIRFNDNDSPYLYRTPASAGNRTTMTWSFWVKPAVANTASSSVLFSAAGGTYGHTIFFNQTGDYNFIFGDGTQNFYQSDQVFRDPSAWYHCVFVIDTDNATEANRIILYVNGERAAERAGYTISSGATYNFNNTVEHRIGSWYPSGGATGRHLDGYISELNFIDGTALDATSFGEVNSDTGQWVPIAYTGSYGTNGFYITGADSADLGADYSGNSNDFTSSGLTSADQMLDTPTDNFCTFSPINTQPSNVTLSDGNLVLSYSGTADTPYTPGTISVSSGKWYWEINSYQGAGAGPAVSYVYTENDTSYSNNTFGYHYTGNFYDNGSSSAYGDSFINTDTIGVALDMDNGAIWFSKNGTWQNSATAAEIAAGTTTNAAKTGISGDYVPIVQRNNGTTSVTANFGQTGGFTYTPPTGFNALSTANLPDPTIALPSDYFQTVLDTGANIKTTAEALYTDQFEWIKDRDNSNNHQLIDSVRGTSAVLQSNSTGAETTYSAPSGNSVAWVWKANGTGSTNTDGSVTSNVSENQAAGFSIATFQKPPADTNETVGHGLGTTPAMTILRWRSGTGGPPSWYVWHQSFSSVGFLRLQGTDAFTADTTVFSSAPSSTVVNTGTAVDSDTNTTEFVMYNFAEVEGFSKFGSYTGNGSSDGPFVYCGFRPAMIICKKSSAAGNDWVIFDNQRDTYNVGNHQLKPNTSDAEFSGGTAHQWDFVSNGFKFKSTGSDINTSGATYVFMAFAQSPFKTANAR
jgi:hypothetical protein